MSHIEELDSLYKQMESELSHLDQKEKQAIKRYMIFAFERGEAAVLKKLNQRR